MPAPASVIPGGILDVSVLAEVAISKFADHLPMSRQIDRVGRLGVELSLSTLSGNLLSITEVWLKPLQDALWVHNRVFLVCPAALPASGNVGKTVSYLNDTGPPIILFHYTQSKAGQHVQDVLSEWTDPMDGACARYLHADAASNYEALYRSYRHIKPVNCWAHARRKFYAIAHESSAAGPGDTAIGEDPR